MAPIIQNRNSLFCVWILTWCNHYMNKLIDKVIKWHQDRNLIKGSTDQAQECLSVAYEDIKNRKGKIIDGVFVK